MQSNNDDQMEKFKTLRNIGNGSFGQCFLCERCSDGEKVVLKKIELKDASKREAYLLNQIKHENIVRAIENYVSYRNVYIVMEYMSGETLHDLITKQKGKSLKDKIIYNYTIQIASALKHIHQEHQIIHHDVKPRNILLNFNKKIAKLCDFGIAMKLESGKKFKGKIGSPGTINYLAPEILEANEYDFKVDIWALGCVIYEMVELKKAFPGEELAVYHKICSRIIVFPEDSKFCPLIKQLINPIQEDRPTAEGVLTLLENSSTNLFNGKNRRLSFWPFGKKHG